MTAPATTAFGAALGSPGQAAALLRARASSAGVPLLPATPTDLAAAVLEAHCWALVTGRSTLTGTMSEEQARDLSGALARAAGHGDDPGDGPAEYWDRPIEDVPVTLLAGVAPVVRWALKHGGADAVHRASRDLATAQHPRLESLAALLSAWELEQSNPQ